MKTCSICKKKQPAVMFGKKKDCANGVNARCLDCVRGSNAKYKKKNKARLRKAAKDWYQENKESIKASRRENCNKVAHAAKDVVANELRYGRIERPEHCEKCGNRRKTEGHHEDYSKPLDVMWLCRSCHLILHADKNRGEGDE